MNDKDLILKTILSNPNSTPDVYYTGNSLKQTILKGKHVDEIEFLLREIKQEKPELFIERKVYGENFAVSPTGLIQSFLEKGGFTEIEKEFKEKQLRELQKSKVDLELAEKMLSEYPKTKWFARIGFFIGVILALLEILKFLFF